MRHMSLFLALTTLASPAWAQMRDNRNFEMTCNSSERESKARVCEIREDTISSAGKLDVQSSHNGGVTVKGWAQNSVLVRARVEAWAENDTEARAISSQVHVDNIAGQIRATGPEWSQYPSQDQDRRWSVSLEVFTPWMTDVKVESHNAGIAVSDLRGQLDIESNNGGLKLIRVAGDVSGRTHNGGIQAQLEGNMWEGRQLELVAYNGGITLAVPASFSANIETQTERGRLDSDFSTAVAGRIDRSNLSFNIGAGGPPIKASTHNGGIRLKKL